MTEQEPEERMHSLLEGVKLPELLVEVNVIVPLGISPDTAAVHEVEELTLTILGEQEIEVIVVALLTLKEKEL